MGLFSSNGASYLGVDIGTSSIKLCELSAFNGRPRLVTYGFTEKSVSSLGSSNIIDDTDEAAQAIRSICLKSNTQSKKAITALPNFSVFTSILNLPAMPKKELASAISWEAKKIIPTPLDEIILDWKIIEELDVAAGNSNAAPALNNPQENKALKRIFSKSKKNLRILLTGANKSLVRKYIEVFNKAGLSLLSLETENFALIRSLVGNDKSNIMVIDLGANTSSISIVEKGIPVLSRSLELGGAMITKAISTSLNINLDRAEQFKQTTPFPRLSKKLSRRYFMK
jgi:type IV pilus assembly protein PilM